MEDSLKCGQSLQQGQLKTDRQTLLDCTHSLTHL